MGPVQQSDSLTRRQALVFWHEYMGSRDAPGLKTLPDALEIRERMLMAFEKAERLKGTPLRRA